MSRIAAVRSTSLSRCSYCSADATGYTSSPPNTSRSAWAPRAANSGPVRGEHAVGRPGQAAGGGERRVEAVAGVGDVVDEDGVARLLVGGGQPVELAGAGGHRLALVGVLGERRGLQHVHRGAHELRHRQPPDRRGLVHAGAHRRPARRRARGRAVWAGPWSSPRLLMAPRPGSSNSVAAPDPGLIRSSRNTQRDNRVRHRQRCPHAPDHQIGCRPARRRGDLPCLLAQNGLMSPSGRRRRAAGRGGGGRPRRSGRSPQLVAIVVAAVCVSACQSTTVAGLNVRAGPRRPARSSAG